MTANLYNIYARFAISLLCAIVFPAAMQIASAQTFGPATLNVAGGAGSAAGCTFEWSLGEVARVNTIATAALTVTEGLLQPYYPGTPTGMISDSTYLYSTSTGPVADSNARHVAPNYSTARQMVATDSNGEPARTIKVYPNPATDNITIDIGPTGEDVTITLADAGGKQLQEVPCLKSVNTSHHIFYNVQALARGTYLLRIYTASKASVEKLVLY